MISLKLLLYKMLTSFVLKAGDTMIGSLSIKNENAALGETPSSSQNKDVYFADSNDVFGGYVEWLYDTSKNSSLRLAGRNKSGSTQSYNILAIGVDANDNATVGIISNTSGTGAAAAWRNALGLGIDSAWSSNKVAKYKKQGNVATVTWSGANTDVAITGDGTTWDSVATIPSGYRPSATVYAVGIMRGITPVRVRITSSGSLDVLSNTAVVTNSSLVFNMTYVI